MASYFRKTLYYLGESIEELILLGIIVLNILDFFEQLNPDWDYIKKIISWAALGYLLYRANLTKLFFGVQNKLSDFILIISYFFLSFKNLLVVSSNTLTELNLKDAGYWANFRPVLVTESRVSENIVNMNSTLSNIDISSLSNLPIGAIDINDVFVNVSNDVGSTLFQIEPKFFVFYWHKLLVNNGYFLQKFSLMVGFILLLMLTIYFVSRIRISSPSLMHIIEEEGDPPKTIKKFFIRFLIIFLVLNFFYISVFNLTMEWLGFAVHAPLIIIGVFFYLLVWLKHHKRFRTESIIYKIGNFGESFYEKFIDLFHSKNGLLFGLSGMLVLHLLTDIGNFIIPYLVGILDPLYFHELGSGHEPILSLGILFSQSARGLFYSDLSLVSGFWDIFYLSFIYLFNIISIIFIFIGPAFIWYIIFKDKEINIPNSIISIFFSSLLCFLLVPVFKLGRVSSDRLVGVDISTQSIINTALYPLSVIVVVSIAIGIISYLILLNKKVKSKMILGALVIIFYYFGKYIYYFFIDTGSYYVNIVNENIKIGEYFIGGYLFIFLALTIIFYIGGFIAYIYEVYNS